MYSIKYQTFHYVLFFSQTLFKLDTNNKAESVKFLSHDVSPLVAVGSNNGVGIWDYSKKVSFRLFAYF